MTHSTRTRICNAIIAGLAGATLMAASFYLMEAGQVVFNFIADRVGSTEARFGLGVALGFVVGACLYLRIFPPDQGG